MSLKTCIPNLKFLSSTVLEISLTKNLERKKKKQTQGRTNRRMPICNPTIQLVVVNLYSKYEVSILKVVEISLTKKCYGITEGRTDGRMEGRTELRTDVNQYSPNRRKPIFNPTIQHVIVNMYTKFEVSI